jgi:hypothetical protein
VVPYDFFLCYTVHGPYLADAKNNDAYILTHIIKNNIDDSKHWVNENDIFIVVSTEDANLSRLVTKASCFFYL